MPAAPGQTCLLLPLVAKGVKTDLCFEGNRIFNENDFKKQAK